MSIVWRSLGGTWRNFSANGRGELFDSASKLIKKGTFVGKTTLHGEGSVVDYSSPDVILFLGNFQNMQKQGAFVRYTISSSEWTKLVSSKTGASVSAIKSICNYDQDTFVSEASSAGVNLQIDIALIERAKSTSFTKFNFVEI